MKKKTPSSGAVLKTFLVSHVFLLAVAVVLGFLARVYKIETPLADWHSWRQADTASVTREYLKHDHPFLEPHYMDLSDIPSGKENLAGYRMVEFPIINYLIAQTLKVFPSWDLVVTSRLFSVALSLITIGSLYALVWQLSRKKMVAFLSALVFALLPYSIYYSRVILPEPAMVMTQVLSVTAFVYWLDELKAGKRTTKGWVLYLLSLVAMVFALLLKPMAIFIAPVFAFLALYTFGLQALTKLELWIFAVIALSPMAWWRHYIEQYPEGIPANTWLFNGNGIRLRPAWWRWLFADRLGRLILGYWGTVLVFLGTVAKERKDKWSMFDLTTLVWAASMVGYLVVFATGNVQHDYYQAMLLPVISLLGARGIWWAMELAKEYRSQVVVYPALLVLLFLTAMFSWNEVRGYYNINNPAIVRAGAAVDRVTPSDALVIAPYMGDTAFLFQTNRRGWPIGGRIEEKIKSGATHYVTTAYDDEAKQLEAQYRVIEKTPEYLILELKSK